MTFFNRRLIVNVRQIFEKRVAKDTKGILKLIGYNINCKCYDKHYKNDEKTNGYFTTKTERLSDMNHTKKIGSHVFRKCLQFHLSLDRSEGYRRNFQI